MDIFRNPTKLFFAFAAAGFLFLGCDDETPGTEEPEASISAINPTTGMVGTEVEIQGQHFGDELDGHMVDFNGTDAEIQSVSNTSIMVIVPEGATSGAVNLRMDGRTIAGPAFTVTEPETSITSITPASGTEGMEVKINGTLFGSELADHQVLFNGTEAEILSVSDQQIIAVVPTGVSTGPVSLTMDGSTFEGPEFTVLDLEESISLEDGFRMDAGINTIGQAFIYEDQAVDGITSLRLTPAALDRVGIAYYAAKIPVENGFETTFDFRISRPGRPEGQEGEKGAEGFAFVIQNQGINARGHRGGSMGYAGIENSLVIEFDVYNNQDGEHNMQDPNGNHISVQSNSADPFGKTGAETYHSLGFTSPETQPGLPQEFIGDEFTRHTARIVYTPGLLQVYVDEMAEPFEVEVDLTDHIKLDNGKAYVGFTASTGVDWGWAAHDILNWTLQPVTEAEEEE